MGFHHAVSVTADNFACTLKLLLYRLISGVVLGSIAYVILTLGLSAITQSPEASHLAEVVGSFFNALFTGETGILHAFQADFQSAAADLVRLIASKSADIIGCSVGLVLIYLLSRFINGLSVFTVGSVVFDRMSTCTRTPFGQAFTRNIARAALYEIIYVPISFAYDVCMVAACWFFFFYAPSILNASGAGTVALEVCLTMTAVVLLQALKMTFVSNWMPSVLSGNSVTKGLRMSFRSGKGFMTRFTAYIAALYLIIVVNAVFAVFTFGSALLITVPLSFVFLLAVQLVYFFEGQGTRYFISRDKIEGERELNA